MIAYDLFRNASDLPGTYVGETGHGWTERLGSWDVQSGRLANLAVDGTALLAVLTNDATPPTADYHVGGRLSRVTASTSKFRYLIRYQDLDNYYAMEHDYVSTATLRLIKRVGGVETTLDQVTVVTSTSPYMRVAVEGSRLYGEYIVSGGATTKLSAKDSAISAAGLGGCYTDVGAAGGSGYMPGTFLMERTGVPFIRDTLDTIISTGTAGGDAAVATPLYTLGDLLLIEAQCQAGDATPGTPPGYSVLAGPFEHGSGTASTRGIIFGYLIDGNEQSPIVGGAGTDHLACAAQSIAGLDHSVPVEVLSTDAGEVAAGTHTIDGGTTSKDKSLVLVLGCYGRNSNTANTDASGWANADLEGFAEFYDRTSTVGLGGGWMCAAGTDLVAGTVGSSTVVVANASSMRAVTLGIRPGMASLLPPPRPLHALIGR